ncbi:MAG: hypothetical protein WA901_17920 [Phormidesmis sp.]
MTTPLQKFRAQYPDSTLTAELISINEGQYVVRAVIGRSGEEIATGLAASVDVQIAEDKARDRALAILNILEDSPAADQSAPDQSVTGQSATGQSATNPPATGQSATNPPVTAQPTTDQPAPAQPTTAQPATDPPTEETSLSDAEEDLGPPIDAVLEEPLLASENDPSSASAIALENFNTSATPVDLSDVIAQTDIELRRLGWNSTQGREYLEENYGKRSRQQLTDEELMSFLLYLEEQP